MDKIISDTYLFVEVIDKIRNERNEEEYLSRRNSNRNSLLEDSDSYSYRKNENLFDKNKSLNLKNYSFESMWKKSCSGNPSKNVSNIENISNFYDNYVSVIRPPKKYEDHFKKEIVHQNNFESEFNNFFYKITSTKKPIFICEICNSKFVYKKCLVNHNLRNH